MYIYIRIYTYIYACIQMASEAMMEVTNKCDLGVNKT